jgi:hypothetical protein
MRMGVPARVKTLAASAYSGALVNKIVIKHITKCRRIDRPHANRLRIGIVVSVSWPLAISQRADMLAAADDPGHLVGGGEVCRRRVEGVPAEARLREFNHVLVAIGDSAIDQPFLGFVGRFEIVGYRRAATITGVERASGLPGVAERRARRCITAYSEYMIHCIESCTDLEQCGLSALEVAQCRTLLS